MKKNIILIIALLSVKFALSGELTEQNTAILPTLNQERFNLVMQAEEEAMEDIRQDISEKSMVKAAFFSALLPGAGEVYAESWWRAALFAGLEVAFWSGKFIYDNKGDDEDARMQSYGDTHWNENRYWTHVISKGTWGGPDPEIGSDGYVTDQFITANRDALADVEKAVYTHELPLTKTQQYYEMIYKYLHQFGVGWDDVESYFGDPYNKATPANYQHPTPMIVEYRDMRNLSNDYYAQADLMLNLVLVNHVFSAVDAAFAAKQHNNKVKYSLKAHQRKIGPEVINLYGISLAW